MRLIGLVISRSRALAVVLVGVLLLSLGSSARSASSDASAIAKFLSIAFANYATNFRSIRGRSTTSDSWAVSKWPDHTHFQRCYTIDFSPIRPSEKDWYDFHCDSTSRGVSREALFTMAARAVRARLPAGYASTGPEKRKNGNIYQLWSRSGYPDVWAWVGTNTGKSFYELSMSWPPQGPLPTEEP
jgi:hypothetical protein